jgi:hypothetical protein
VKRLVALVAVAAYALLGLAWLAHEPVSDEPHDPGSSFDTSAKGASLAFAYLEGRAPKGSVRRLTLPVRATELERDAVVLRIRPAQPRLTAAPDSEREKPRRQPLRLLGEAEEAWVQAGGRLVIALSESVGPLAIGLAAEAPPPRKVHPLFPGVARVLPSPRRALQGPLAQEAVTLFASGSRPVVARLALGAGEVFLLACPEVLENALVGRGDHLALLEALAGRGRTVYFDEHAHGLRVERGLLALLLDWGLGPALALAALAGLASLWRGRARLGPAEDAWQDRRSDAVDLVDSLAQLYERALRRDEAAALYHETLRHAVSLRTGLRGAPLAKRVQQLCGGASPPQRGPGRDISAAALDDIVARINRAFGGIKHGHAR